MSECENFRTCGAKVYAKRLSDAMNTDGWGASKAAIERGEGLRLPACVLPKDHEGGHMLDQSLWESPEPPPSPLSVAQSELAAEREKFQKETRRTSVLLRAIRHFGLHFLPPCQAVTPDADNCTCGLKLLRDGRVDEYEATFDPTPDV